MPTDKRADGTIPRDVLRRAAEWAARLDGGAGAAEREACESWCREDPRHRLVFDRMQGLDVSLAGLDAAQRQLLRDAAVANRPRRRQQRLALSLLLVAGSAALAWLSFREPPAEPVLATARGEQRTLQLPDHSTLVIDADSAVGTRMDAARREVRLQRGRILATVAPDPQRAFEVVTADATATALGTAYVVDVGASGTRVTVVESTVRVCGNAAGKCRQLLAGESLLVRDGRPGEVEPADARAATAWTRGWLEADDLPLQAALEEISRHLDQPLEFDAAALAQLRITGSYPLNRPLDALQAMALSTGLMVEEAGGVLSVRSAN